MSSATGLFLSYAIGLIFVVGGVLFLIFLEDNRFLFGIPYVILGVLLVGGVSGSQRRARRKAAEAIARGEEPPEPSH